MRRANCLGRLGMMCGVGLLLNGCLIKPSQVPTRQFILVPIRETEDGPSAARQPLVEVGSVKMPSYLLRDSMMIRKSTTEIEYLEDALWADRLDQSFRQTLADNLSTLLRSDRTYISAAERDQKILKVSVELKQFDVDSQGRGTLLARWQFIARGADKPFKSGETSLARSGPSPRGNPQAIATTLSALTADFSRELAQAIRASPEAERN